MHQGDPANDAKHLRGAADVLAQLLERPEVQADPASAAQMHLSRAENERFVKVMRERRIGMRSR